MQFLREKTEVPKREYGLAVTLKFRVVQIGENLKYRQANQTIFRHAAMDFHPAVPFVDLEVFIKDDKTDIDGIKYLIKYHSYCSMNKRRDSLSHSTDSWLVIKNRNPLTSPFSKEKSVFKTIAVLPGS